MAVGLSAGDRWRSHQAGEEGRHHVHETLLQKAVRKAVFKAGIVKRVGGHAFATHLLEAGYESGPSKS
jgi:site-specific recombinase XerD